MLTALHVITLMSLHKYGRKTVKAIIDKKPTEPTSIPEYLDMLGSLKKQLPKLPLPSLNEVAGAYEKAHATLDRCYKEGIKAIAFDEENFPSRLKNIPDPPVVIYAKGNTTLLSSAVSVAVIGTREPTEWGFKAGRRLACVFAEKGITVVSGLALGCDSAAHIGCLDGKGHTIGILAHGLDKIYPAKNRDLAEKILSGDGLFVSEYPPGTPAMANYFVERDRLQSGLSDAVVVVETGIKSGTMHTVNFCLEQRRILCCIQHPKEEQIGNLKSEGNRLLIREKGAFSIGDQESLNAFIQKVMNTITKKCQEVPTSDTRPTNNDQIQYSFSFEG